MTGTAELVTTAYVAAVDAVVAGAGVAGTELCVLCADTDVLHNAATAAAIQRTFRADLEGERSLNGEPIDRHERTLVAPKLQLDRIERIEIDPYASEHAPEVSEVVGKEQIALAE